MIRVVHVITGLDVGGAELALYRLLAATDPARVRSAVISLTDVGPVGERIRELGIPVRAFEMRRPERLPAAPARLVRLLRASSPDVVQTWMHHADLLGGLAARAAGIRPVVWGLRMSVADATESRATRAVVAVNARLSHAVPQRILCCSDAVRRAHRDIGYAEDRMVVIENGFEIPAADADHGDLRAELGIASDAPVIGRVGRFHPVKDHATFARAAAVVQRHHPDAAFVLCGLDVDDANTELQAMFARGGVTNVHLLGPRDDMDRVYGTLDVLCSSSVGEGFPNVIGEAMARGVPAVATDVGASADIVGPAGIVVPPRDPEALGAALSTLLSRTPEDRRRLGASAREHVEREFGMRRMVERYESLYRTLLP